ncbi:hypothetical protein FOZ63_032177 [Perkinsus olseni]|uniref:Uncharacterized protein n=1 Tax=Perkinsus olseni TaxID=32597 RepID=A0A7J6U0H9_PEROL|nr:hypothetical protein FOZ63_032177 [Perkinsus olseni]
MEITESLNPMEAQRRRDPVRRIAESDPSRMTNTMFASKYPVGAVLYFRTDQKEVTDSQIKEHFRKLGAKDSMVVHHTHGHIYGLVGFPTAAEMKTKLGQAACSALGIWARPFSSAARGNYQRAFESRQLARRPPSSRPAMPPYSTDPDVVPEIVVKARLAGIVVDCIIDSASGFSYLSSYDLPNIPLAPLEVVRPTAARVANGVVVRIHQYISGELEVSHRHNDHIVCKCIVEVRILPCKRSLGARGLPAVLVGRDLMSKLSIRVEAHRCTCQGQLVYDSNGEDVNCITSLLESDLVCRLVETLHGSSSGPASQPSEFAVSEVQKGTALKYCEALGERLEDAVFPFREISAVTVPRCCLSALMWERISFKEIP